MTDPLFLALAAVTSLISAPIGAYVRALFLREKGTRRISVESEGELVDIAVQQDESPAEIAVRVGEAVAESDSATVGGRNGKPPRFEITLVELIYGAALLVGIFAKAIWDYNSEHNHVGVDWSDTVTASIVAPIVYVGVYAALKPVMSSVTLVGLGIAFQNGFFWQTVFAAQEAASSA